MILGDGIRLRAIEKADIPRFVRWLNDPEVTRFLSFFSPLSTAMEENWFEQQLKSSPAEGQVFSIEVQAGDDWIHIGNTGLHQIESINRSAEFGIFIGETGYHQNLNLNRIYLYVCEANSRAINTYEKAGFVHEGVLREAVFKQGCYVNLVLMSVLKSEWVNLPTK
jgi:RimJ/RimL family protein N-acetyltransferase